jgi:hypothetical protein
MVTRSYTSRGRGLAVSAAVVAACCVGPPGIAYANPVFDVDAYSECTSAPPTGADQDVDGVVSSCCVRNAGVPTPTKFGMGCAAPLSGSDPDERPLIVLPMRPIAPDKGDSDLNGLVDLPLPEALP